MNVDGLLADRNRLPAFVNRGIDWVADHPMSLAGRLVARRMGRPPAGSEHLVASADPSAPVRVLIAPVNYSGQAREWARSLESADPRISARNFAVDVPGGFDFPADVVVPVAAYHNSPEWQAAQWRAIGGFTHVLVEAEEPLLGRMFGRDPARECEALRDTGISLAYLAHGTDLRSPRAHLGRTRWSPYADPGVYVKRLESLAERNRALLRRSGAPLFVSTPDLLAELPEASWCPVVVEPERWRSDRIDGEGPLRVVHAPSSAIMKGTDLIAPVVSALHEQGTIEYRPVRGVASHTMPKVFGAADVLLDQFRLGSYGVAACEGMAAGLVVVGHVLPDVREAVLRHSGRQLPIVEATPETVGDVLRVLSADPQRCRELGEAGRVFVREVHDGRMSARTLIDEWIGR